MISMKKEKTNKQDFVVAQKQRVHPMSHRARLEHNLDFFLNTESKISPLGLPSVVTVELYKKQ